MELKDKYKLLHEIFSIKENEEFSEAIMRVVMASNAFEYFQKYLNVLPDLNKDELRSCWQFWHSDREIKKQDYTSDSLADLVAAFLDPKPGDVVYDCCAGSGSLSLGVWRRCKDVSIIAEELDEGVIPLQLFNFAIRNINAKVRVCDVLSRECTEQYNVIKGERFSTIEKVMFPDTDIKCTKSVSNPPFNLKANGLPLNYQFVKQCMDNSQKGVFILPCGVLSSQGKEAEQRGDLVETGWLKAVATMPQGFFESTGVSVCVLLCDKRNTSGGVMLIDAESLSSTEVREQRGEGDASHTSRVYRKEMKVIKPEQITSLCGLIDTPTQISTFADIESIREGKYSLMRGAYMRFEPDSTNVLHRSYNDIVKEINQIARIRNSFKITINKVWAEDLGLKELITLEEQNKIVTDAINKSLDMLGIEERIISPDYISQSNSKELIIRQMDKECLSPVMVSFLPLLTQHIRTMNMFENNLLAELRDALLPALMSGKIELKV